MTIKNKEGAAIRVPPLIKWPGGKRAIVESIVPQFPATPKRYFEPFLGGGAVFFALQPKQSWLSDTNEELINLYRQVRDWPDDLIKVLRTFKNSEEAYYQIRSQSFRSPMKRAARLLYLTTLSFNGLYRVNLQGQFNVPYEDKTHFDTCDENRIPAASRALASARLDVADSETATSQASACDPLYILTPLHCCTCS